MTLNLKHNSTIKLETDYNNGVQIEIQEDTETLSNMLMETMLDTQAPLNEDLIQRFFEQHEDHLHLFLQRSGYIYNKI